MGAWGDAIPELRAAWLRGDLLAGVTVAAYLVPQVMAYATVAGLTAGSRIVGRAVAAGRLRAIGIVAAAVGRSGIDHRADDGGRAGPDAAGDPQRYAALAAAVAWLSGAMCFLGRHGAVGFSGRSVVAAGAGRIHDRRRDRHDRQPTRQDHRRAGGGDEFVDQMQSFAAGHRPATLADDRCWPHRFWRCSAAGAVGATLAGPTHRRARGDRGGGRFVVGCRAV